jgi:hypothetical protein
VGSTANAAVSELEQIRAILREYFTLEATYKPIDEGWKHLRLRGIAREAWLKKARNRLAELREQIIAFANADRVAP